MWRFSVSVVKGITHPAHSIRTTIIQLVMLQRKSLHITIRIKRIHLFDPVPYIQFQMIYHLIYSACFHHDLFYNCTLFIFFPVNNFGALTRNGDFLSFSLNDAKKAGEVGRVHLISIRSSSIFGNRFSIWPSTSLAKTKIKEKCVQIRTHIYIWW